MSKPTISSFFTIAVVLAYAAWALPVVVQPNQGEHASADVASSKPKPCTDAAFGETCVPLQSPLMFTEYLACSSKSETLRLSRSEVIACMEAYLAVKLSFISEIEPEYFREMSRERQIEINRRAFMAYRKWRDENPNLVLTPSANPGATPTSI